MSGFRSIYHLDPSDVHAPRAVEQVAVLLAEEGHELHDRKSLHDAARQYEFLADQYPASALAPEALGRSIRLLGAGESDDPVEARRVQVLLTSRYPKYARYLATHPDNTAPQPGIAAASKPVVGKASPAVSRDQYSREAVPAAQETQTSFRRAIPR